MVSNIDAENFLRGIYAKENYKQYHAIQRYDFDEFCSLLRPYRTVVTSCCVTHIKRDFLGYYFLDPDRREIWGMQPINFLEFFIFCINVACILFFKPTLDVCIFYASHVFQEHGLDLCLFDCIVADLILIYESGKKNKTD